MVCFRVSHVSKLPVVRNIPMPFVGPSVGVLVYGRRLYKQGAHVFCGTSSVFFEPEVNKGVWDLDALQGWPLLAAAKFDRIIFDLYNSS